MHARPSREALSPIAIAVVAALVAAPAARAQDTGTTAGGLEEIIVTAQKPKEGQGMGRASPLILHTECSDGWGGQEIRILEELRGMRRYGCATALIAPQHSRIFSRAQAEGFEVHAVRFGNKGHLPSWARLFKLMTQLKPDVVNTHSSEDSWMAGFAARMLGVPLIIRTRHVSTPIGSAFSYKAFPHLILTTSQAIRESLIACGIDQEKLSRFPRGSIRIDFTSPLPGEERSGKSTDSQRRTFS